MTFFTGNNSLINYKTIATTPGVLFVASSPEVYADVGGNCNQTTFSNVIPSATASGDLILALIFARSSITNSSGFGLLASQAVEGTTSGQYSAIYMKTASPSDANSTITFTQSVASRAAMSIIVLRAAVGTLLLDSFSSNSSASTAPALPVIPVSLQNSVAIALYSTSAAYTNEINCGQYITYSTVPVRYTQTTNSSGNACVSCTNPRICAGYRFLVNEAETGQTDAFTPASSPTNCGQIIAVFKDSAASSTTPLQRNLSLSSSPVSDSSPFVGITGRGTSAEPITGYVGGSGQDSTDRNLYLTSSTTGTLYYNCTASSEAGWDYGYLYVNNVLIFQIDGSTNRTGSVAISSGQQVRIRYTKDGSDTAGTDRLIINSLYVA